jgi:hypothetical protein
LTKFGVNEFLCKPLSAKGLFERLIFILLKPRESVRYGKYYSPAPRRLAAVAQAPVIDPDGEPLDAA